MTQQLLPFDPANITEASALYQKYYGDAPTLEVIIELITRYNEVAVFHNSTDWSKYEYIIPATNDYIDFDGYLGYQKKSNEELIRRGIEQKKRQDHILSLPQPERFCVHEGVARDSYRWKAIHKIYNTELYNELCKWNLEIEDFKKILNFYSPDSTERVDRFLASKPSCLEWGYGVAGDGGRVLRTVGITCEEYEVWNKS